MSELSKDQRVKLLRYGELIARRARNEASPQELEEIDEIRKDFKVSEQELISIVENLVHKHY